MIPPFGKYRVVLVLALANLVLMTFAQTSIDIEDEQSFEENWQHLSVKEKCHTCIYLLLSLKKSHVIFTPGGLQIASSFCTGILSQSVRQDEKYQYCKAISKALNLREGELVRRLLAAGCIKHEEYDDFEKILPCPIHEICAEIHVARGHSCPQAPMERTLSQ